VFRCFARAAKFRICDRDEVMNHVDGPNVGAPNPLSKPGGVQAGVSDIEIKPPESAAVHMRHAPKRTCDEARLERLAGLLEQGEQFLRRSPVENSPEPSILNDSLSIRAEMAQISETHSIDAGRKTPLPAAPDQARHIEEDRSIVSH
jgi:hypothetical protein